MARRKKTSVSADMVGVVTGFVGLLCGYMGDYIASDREAAAFMLAWAALPEYN